MAVLQLARVIQSLRRTRPHDDANVSDGRLLDQFIEHQDQAAFAALVERHGPMVWGVCRRILAHHQDAEDAFQATFLVLARKAASIRPRGMVGNWLFGVARRTGLKAKTMADKRRSREKQVLALPEPEALKPGRAGAVELLIDQELACLPDKYRIAIILCDLEGKTNKVAARHLKVPEGTLATRLRTGRVLLAKRLARRGVTLSGGALALLLSQNAARACMPAALASSTVKAANLIAPGTAGAGAISANVTALMEGVLKAMMLSKLKSALAGLLVAGLLVFAVLSRPATAAQDGEEPTRQTPPSPKKETPQAKKEIVAKVVYQVADLVVPIPGLDVAPGGKPGVRETKEEWLIDKITRSVAPGSWERFGGTGSIEYFPLTMALVVKNTPRVQDQVRRLLETMRRAQDVQVVVQTRLVSLSAASFLKLQALVPQLKKNSHAVLSELETCALLRKAQDDGVRIIDAPKITFFSGQRVSLAVDGIKDFVEPAKLEVRLTAFVAANLKHIDLEVKAKAGDVEFGKAERLVDGTTMVQCKHVGADHLLFLVTPQVILNLEEEMDAARDGAALPKAKVR